MPKNNKVVKQPSSQRNLAKSNVSPSSQPDERLIESKKSLSSGNYTKFSQKNFKGDDYLPTFIKEAIKTLIMLSA